MIPGNPNLIIADRNLRAPFLAPDNRIEESELVAWELGGIAIQDTSEDLDYQNWKGYWDASDSTVYLVPDDTGIPIPLFVLPDVVEFSFTFDQNMRWSTVCRLSSNQLEHRWFDTAIGDYVVTTYSGIQSIGISLDDKSRLYVAAGRSDIILTYIKTTGQLCWRIQRDRFLTEYTQSGFSVPTTMRITHFGMNSKNRLQWRVGVRRIK